jgi:hypothetical protein
MKKSIAFLGALLFGSVTFGQVTKNDTIKKPTARKVSSDDMKKFADDSETTSGAAQTKMKTSEKHSSDASAGKGASEKIRGGTQKGATAGGPATTEKMHFFGKVTNANARSVNFKEKSDGTEPEVIKEKGGAIQNKQDIHIKMAGDKVAKDPVTPTTTGASNQFLKITDVKGEKEK